MGENTVLQYLLFRNLELSDCLNQHDHSFNETHFCLLSQHRSGRWVQPAWTPNSIGTEWRSGSESPGPTGGQTHGRKTVEQTSGLSVKLRSRVYFRANR